MPWEGAAARLEGRLVVVEPLGPEHEDDLVGGGTGPCSFVAGSRGTPQPTGRPSTAGWRMRSSAASPGSTCPSRSSTGRAGGRSGARATSPSRPEHRGLEIGWTWNASSAWGTGANAEAKLLLLRHAFETLGCIRVEFKTDALNERSRAALEALPARFEGIFAKAHARPRRRPARLRVLRHHRRRVARGARDLERRLQAK